MRLDLSRLSEAFATSQEGKKSEHSAQARLEPSPFQFDYLNLRTLSDSIRELIAELPARPGATAVDIGADRSPYRALLEKRGYSVRTLDIDPASGADLVGTAEETGLEDRSVDLVLCTQVMEHSRSPWLAIREIARILRAEGRVIFTVPHVWFYHPHPADNWRFTQEGCLRLCEEGGLRPLALLAQGGTALTLAQVLNFAVYGAVGRSGWPVYWAMNRLGMLADRWVRNELFCHNFACMAEKPAGSSAPV
jgi:SAM-dependent methyltransferase